MASKEAKKSGKRSKKRRGRSNNSSSEDETVREEEEEESAPPIVNMKCELQRFVDLGLGRGVNATDTTPWLNKSSFQVREVTERNIIGTDEGGAVQSYETEIHSTFTLQTELQASITIPQSPVTIGVDAEQSRSVSSSRKAVGQKVLNRTISFRADFEDVPFRKSHQSYGNNSQEAEDEIDGPRAVDTALQQSQLTFEERLCKWILDRIEADDDASVVMQEALEGRRGNPGDDLPRALLKFKPGEKRKKIRLAIQQACSDFAHTFNITHYVCAIHLGASKYTVFTEEDYNLELKTKASVGVDQIGGGSASMRTSWSKSSKKGESKTIGRISEEGTVKRGSSEEAVVGIKLTPITTLIKFPNLRRHFENALEDYVDELQDLSHGPFYIAANNESLLLCVNPHDNSVYATEDFHNASLFFVIPTDNATHPNEFYITYRGDSFKPEHSHADGSSCGSPDKSARARQMRRKKQQLHGIPRYLDTPVQRGGHSHGPLQLKFHVRESDSRFTLINRVIKGSNPVSTAPWIAHRDIFFIKCARRGFNKHSFLAVKRREGSEEWISCCVKSKTREDRCDTFMLFRLLPKTYLPSGFKVVNEGQKKRKASEGGEKAKAGKATAGHKEEVQVQLENGHTVEGAT